MQPRPRPRSPPSDQEERERYHVPHRAVVLSIMFFVALTVLSIFIALFTSFLRAQHSAAAAASSAAVSQVSQTL